MDIDALRQQLADSRARLIASLQGASESDYSAELDIGMTVIAALADLARRERAAVEEARRLAELPPRPSPAPQGEGIRRLTPPPVVHDLAGARHETQLLVEALAVVAGERSPAGTGIEAAVDLLGRLVEAERDLAARIDRRVGQHRTPPAA